MLLPGITFGLLYVWPFLEARFTKDHEAAQPARPPRDRPVRTALGVAALAFYTVLFSPAATTSSPSTFNVSAERRRSTTFRVLLFVAARVVAFASRRICRDLRDRAIRQSSRPGGRIRRTRTGGYVDERRAGTRRA